MANIWITYFGGFLVGAVSSQSLMDLCFVLMTLSWIVLSVKKGWMKAPTALEFIGIEWAFLLYFLVALAGIFIHQPDGAPFSILLKFLWMFHLYILVFTLKQVRLEAVSLVKYFSAFFLFPTLYSFTGYINGYDPITLRESSRIQGLVNSATYHAHGNAVIFVFFGALLAYAWQSLSRNWKWIAASCFCLLGLSIFLTFTRGIWLSILVSTLVMMSFYNLRKAVPFICAGLILFGTAYVSWPRFTDRVNSVVSAFGGDPYRRDLFILNVQIFKEHPLLGIGYGENIRRNREYWDRPEWKKPPGYMTSHAHNQILNVLSTTGILGLIPFLMIWIFFITKNWKLLRRTEQKLKPFRYVLLFACLWAQFEFILGCLTDVSFEYAKIRALILAVWALVIALERKPEIAIENSEVVDLK